MFLSTSGRRTNETKGLASLAVDRQRIPTHLNEKDLIPAAAQYRPETRAPTRGVTELTREDRHSAHLRKKRHLKTERVRKDKLLRSLAQTNGKLRSRLEKQDALKTLSKSKNVQIIKTSGMKSKK